MPTNTHERNEMRTMRGTLEYVHVDYTNNYLTVEKYAEHHGLTTWQAIVLLDLARSVNESQHPDA